jgi:hypothetical protein
LGRLVGTVAIDAISMRIVDWKEKENLSADYADYAERNQNIQRKSAKSVDKSDLT